MIHYIDRNLVKKVLSQGLVSPGYALSSGDEELADSMLEKYKARSGAINRDQVVQFLKRLRKRDDALNAIYAFDQKIPPEAISALNAAGKFNNKVPVSIDIDGYDVQGVYNNKRDIAKTIAKNLSSSRPVFASVPHFAIYPESGLIPPDRLKVIE